MATLWEDDAAELRRRWWVAARIVIRNVTASVIALAFVTIYEALAEGESLRTAVDQTWRHLGRDGLSVLLLILAFLLILLSVRRLQRWYLPIRGPLPREADPTVQKQALLPPLLTAGVAFTLWELRGIIVGIERSGGPLPTDTMFHTLVSNGMAGLIAAVLVYFATEALWQHELPLFFPDGKIPRGRVRFTVRTRILLLFVMGMTSLVYLAVVAYHWAERLLDAQVPEAVLHTLLYVEVLIIAAAGLTAFTLAATLGATLINGLKRIHEGLQRVERGDLETRVRVYTNDEIGELAEGFNRMVEGLRAQQVTRYLFNHYVSPEVANYALQHGAERGGVLTEATVLFSDIRSFTTLAEGLPPTKVMTLLNRYFQAMEEAIRAYGGIINKFVGDSLMAIFGTPLNPLPDHAEASVWAAAEMMRTLRLFNEAQRVRGEPTLRIGIGIATGTVVAGNVGGTERIEYTLIGNTVNVASRLESMTKKMGVPILLAEATAQAASASLPLRLLGAVKVRGKQEPVTVYTLEMSYDEEEP